MAVQPAAAPELSIIIPTLNAGHDFAATLAAIANQSVDVSYEVVVIDSGSQDDTVKYAQEAGARIIRIEPAAFHHARTRNQAAETCHGRYLLFLVQDAVPANDHWLQALVDALDEDQGVVGAYSAQIPHGGASALSTRLTEAYQQSLDATLRQELTVGQCLEDLTEAEQIGLCRFDNVSSIMFRKVWSQHPFPDVDYAEDVAWAREILLAGLALRRALDSVVSHSHERSSDYVMRREYVQARTLGDLFGGSVLSLERDDVVRLLQLGQLSGQSSRLINAVATGLMGQPGDPGAVIPFVEPLFPSDAVARLLGEKSSVSLTDRNWLAREATEDWVLRQLRPRLASGASLLLVCASNASAANGAGPKLKALFAEPWILERASYRDMLRLPGALLRRRSHSADVLEALTDGEEGVSVPRSLWRCLLRRVLWHWSVDHDTFLGSIMENSGGKAVARAAYHSWRMACWLWHGMALQSEALAQQVATYSLVATVGRLLGEAAREGGDPKVRSVLDARLAKGV